MVKLEQIERRRSGARERTARADVDAALESSSSIGSNAGADSMNRGLVQNSKRRISTGIESAKAICMEFQLPGCSAGDDGGT